VSSFDWPESLIATHSGLRGRPGIDLMRSRADAQIDLGHWRLLIVVEQPSEGGLGEVLAPTIGDLRVRLVVSESERLPGAINIGDLTP
jgi:hypothetical protein